MRQEKKYCYEVQLKFYVNMGEYGKKLQIECKCTHLYKDFLESLKCYNGNHPCTSAFNASHRGKDIYFQHVLYMQ